MYPLYYYLLYPIYLPPAAKLCFNRIGGPEVRLGVWPEGNQRQRGKRRWEGRHAMYPSMSSELWARQHRQDLLQEASVERCLQALRSHQQQAREGGTRHGRLEQAEQRLQAWVQTLGARLGPAHGHSTR
jgi:hypothetical protein